jgi:two-component system sensor histidine kinase KdpD
MLVVGIVISNLMINVRSQAKVASHRERRAAVLYAMSKDLGSSQTEMEVVRTAVKHLYSEFSSRNVILLPNEHGRIVFPKAQAMSESLQSCDLSVAQWVFDHNEIAGHGTNTLPGSAAIYYPFHNEDTVLGVLALLPVNLRRVFLPEQQKLLETFLRQIAQSITRIRFVEQAKLTHTQIEAERLRNSLLSAISHDLRTPLATIIGSASTLIDDGGQLQSSDKLELNRAIFDEAERMSSLVNNILDMARLNAGALELNKQWYPLEEIIGTALTQTKKKLLGRSVKVKLPEGIPMLFADAVLIEQVLINLLENAARYTPPDSALDISAESSNEEVKITVADRGPGIPNGQEERLFEKFYQTRHEAAQSGVGLGLAICQAIVKVHGGRIYAQNRIGGGAEFIFVIPLDRLPPTIEE